MIAQRDFLKLLAIVTWLAASIRTSAATAICGEFKTKDRAPEENWYVWCKYSYRWYFASYV
jgi:hypothetical protein